MYCSRNNRHLKAFVAWDFYYEQLCQSVAAEAIDVIAMQMDNCFDYTVRNGAYLCEQGADGMKTNPISCEQEKISYRSGSMNLIRNEPGIV